MGYNRDAPGVSNRLDSPPTAPTLPRNFAMRFSRRPALAVALLLVLGFAVAPFVHADSSVKEEMRAKIAEDAQKQKDQPAAQAAGEAKTEEKSEAADDEAADDAEEAADETEQSGPGVLPRVELRSRKFTEHDKVLQKYEKQIAEEKEELEPNDFDDALNDEKRSFSIFGGRTRQYRKQIAKERVYLLEFEKDLVEAKAKTTSKEEKEALQKYIDDIKKMRRELEMTER